MRPLNTGPKQGPITIEAHPHNWVELAERFVAHRRNGGTDLAGAEVITPSWVYTEPSHYARELDLIFRKGPLLIGLAGDVRERGHFLTTEIAGMPIMVVRAADDLKAFLNTCPHRGARLLERSGHLKTTMQCPFHGWVFGVDGRRRDTRGFQQGFAGLPCGSTDLRPLPVWEKNGFVYVAGTSDHVETAPMDSIRLLGADFAALQLENYTLFRENVSLVPMNWKMPVDSFLETYHVPSLHRDSVAPLYYGTPVLFDARGWNARMCQWRRSTPDSVSGLAAETQFHEHGNLIYFLFPNVILNFPVPGALELWHMMPQGPNRARVTTRYYTNRPVTSSRAIDVCNQNFELSNRVVYQEDFPLHTAVNEAMSAGAIDSVVFGRNEPGLIHFHQLLAQRLGTSHG